MRRDLDRLASDSYDLVVVGGGIYGAWVAWDAVLRGLSVALLEQGDFGHATSANSHKIAHGGFRYVQNGDLTRLRESSHERNVFLRLVPHLVRPLPFLIPTYRRGVQSRPVLGAALRLYDALTWDRNREVRESQRQIPSGRLVSRRECLWLAPGLDDRGVTGGAIWYDGLIASPDRLTLSVIRSAWDAGAAVANYVRVTRLLEESGRVHGVEATDVLSGRTVEVAGRLVINTAGPWVNRVLAGRNGRAVTPIARFAKAFNVVLNRSITSDCGVSVLVPHRTLRHEAHDGCCRRYHLVPWRGRTIAGSLYLTAHDDPEERWSQPAPVEQVIEHLRRAYPSASLSVQDVSLVHTGLLPLAQRGPQEDPNHLDHRYQLIDHQTRDHVEGLLSVIGVKYTTARDVAEKTVNLALKKLGRAGVVSRSASACLRGGGIQEVERLVQALGAERPCGLEPSITRQLVAHYGSYHSKLLELVKTQAGLGERVAATSEVIRAQVVYAAREEMAQTLSDVVMRRTELGTAGHPGLDALHAAAEVLAVELGWDESRAVREVEQADTLLRRCGARAPAEPVGASR